MSFFWLTCINRSVLRFSLSEILGLVRRIRNDVWPLIAAIANLSKDTYKFNWIGPQTYPHPNSWNLWLLPCKPAELLLMWFNEGILRCKDYPGWSGRALHVITIVFIKRSQREIWLQKKGKRCDAWSRAWNGAATSQGMLATTGNWKRQEGFSPGASRRNPPWWHIDFRAVWVILDFWPPEL